MIVICTKCQAKFRVADDKIGPRGAKVRCSKCQTVFLVHAALGTVPVTDGEGGHPPAPPAAAPPPPPPPPAADPFGGADPFAAQAPADPFGAAPAPVADPFAGDPFGAAPAPAAPAGGLGDPFVAAVAPRSTLPVTDLSDLLGSGGAPAAAAPPPLPKPPPLPGAAAPQGDPFAPPAPAVAAPAPPPPAAPDPFGDDPFAAADPFASAAGAPAAPAGAPEAAAPSFELAPPGPLPDGGGLALEDRLTPPPRPLAPDPGPLLDPTLETAAPDAPAPAPGADPFAPAAAGPGAAAEPFDPGAFDFGGDAGEPFAPEPGLPPPEPPSAPARAAAPAPRAPAPAAAPLAAAAPAPADADADASAPAVPDRVPGAPRLRAVAVNAVALVALLVVALGLWVVWRSEGPFEAASLRPSAVLAALGRGGARTTPWSAQDVRSGVYDRARGAPLLFVRGRVVSRAPAPVAAVKVAVQVVRGREVLARGEALAGAVPTAEELYLAGDDAAIAAVRGAARGRAPAQIRPGDAVPFLVAIGDAPPDLLGASLRIDLVPAADLAP